MVKRIIIFICWLSWHCQGVQPAKCDAAGSLLNDLDTLRRSKALSTTERINLLPSYEQRLSTCGGHFDSTHTKILRTIGDVYFDGLDYPKAIIFYQKAIAITETHVNESSVKPELLVTDYYKLYMANDAINNVTEKMNALDSCAMKAIRLKSVDIYSLYALYKRAEYCFHIGDYHRCIEYAKTCENSALEFSKKNKSVSLDYVTSSVEWQMNGNLVLGELEKAKALLQDKISQQDSMQLTSSLGNTYGFLADFYWYGNDHERALPLFLKSLQCFEKAIETEKDSSYAFNYKATLNLLGYHFYFKHLKNEKKAFEVLRKALSFPVLHPKYQVENRLESTSILNRIANIFAAKGQFDSAMQYFQNAFDQIKPGITENDFLEPELEDFLENKRRSFVATLIFDKGDVLLQKYRSTHDSNSIKQALQVFKIGDQFLERVKTEQSDYKSKLFWRSDRRKLYESAIEASYLAGNPEDAFHFFEKSRAVLLFDQLKEQRLLSKEDLIRQGLLKKQVAQLEKEIYSSDTSKKLQYLQQQIQAQKELDKINNVFASRNPYYSQGHFDVGKDLLKVTQANLSKEKAIMVEFFDGDSAVYSMVLDSNRISLNKLNKSRFDTAVNEFQNYLFDKALLNRDFVGFVNTSNDLYRMIFGVDSLPPGKIIVSPDSRYFPIEALLTNRSIENPSYVLKTHTVSYTHSANFLNASRNSIEDVGAKDFLGVAPVKFNPTLDRIPLNGSDQSLKNLKSEIDNARIITYRRASKENFLREFGKYEVIQLYTHASGGTGQEEPVIFFSDSTLYLSELIGNKKTQTRLIVLSACETGKGKWYGGEGVFSFNRGFAALGVPSTVTNLWSVENKSTYRLTELFYKHLRSGVNLDTALQKAKLEFMRTGSREEQLPYYWAAGILTGSTEPIELSEPSYLGSYFNWIGFFIFIMMTFAVWINYNRIKLIFQETSAPSLRFS